MSMAANDGERKAAKFQRLAGFPPPVGGCAVLGLLQGTPGQRRIRAAGSTPASAGKVSPYYRAALQPPRCEQA